ncbi:HAD hydrolase-like protein [Prevotella sp. A2931]|uniref:HAD hydrolase-like protein n=1 Tax=Prevotella illustrans TaxID=2800387 RepID=A0ABS3M2K8_9BACT|nr:MULTISPECIES: HAD family hydrolase [Prevotella]MBO1362424.1 HAD hydrolase-like protein [Prevotella illustrans]PTL25063.1 hypothetical protein C3V39_10080 [Prevotella sp. oral taxon 820]
MKIKVIAFDADDTLWDCQSYFDKVETQYTSILSAYGTAEQVKSCLFKTETANMPALGYGCKAFTISLVENAIKMSRGDIPASAIADIVTLGKSLLNIPAHPLPQVEDTLNFFRKHTPFKLAVFTKGELLDQENKLKRSGLTSYFHHVKIVSDKTPAEFQNLCETLHARPQDLLMVGNSLKSDIIPALQIGAHAVHIPFHTTWLHESVDDFVHNDLITIQHFSELLQICL